MTDLTSDFLASDEALVVLPNDFDPHKLPNTNSWLDGFIKKGAAILAKKVPTTEKFLVVMVPPKPQKGDIISFYQLLEIGLETLFSNPTMSLNSTRPTNPTQPTTPTNKEGQQSLHLPQKRFEEAFEVVAIIDSEGLAKANSQANNMAETEEDFHPPWQTLPKELGGLFGSENSGYKKLKEWVS